MSTFLHLKEMFGVCDQYQITLLKWLHGAFTGMSVTTAYSRCHRQILALLPWLHRTLSIHCMNAYLTVCFNRHCITEPSIMHCISLSVYPLLAHVLFAIAFPLFPSPPLHFHVSLPALLLWLALAGCYSFHQLRGVGFQETMEGCVLVLRFFLQKSCYGCLLLCTAGLLGFNITLVIYF